MMWPVQWSLLYSGIFKRANLLPLGFEQKRSRLMLLYALTIFASAFLLFQVQPMIAKIILPWFGGLAAVWTTCLLFFQAVLLFGYAYAHWLARYFRPKAQTRAHITLLALSVLALPILPKSTWKPTGPEDPTLHILVLLAATVGLPYFLLSTTSPLLQAWYQRVRSEGTPYRLFGLSNAGSMLGLLSYPLIMEPKFSTRHQAMGWSLGYIGLSILCAAVALRPHDDSLTPQELESPPAPNWKDRLLWAGLAACASTLLLAVTNHLSLNVSSVPFLWVLTLSMYLLSFILCFAGNRWYRRGLFLALLGVALAVMSHALSYSFIDIALTIAIPLFSVGLFICCMVCHGELARLKPHPAHLTSFYLMVSMGGTVGAIFVSLLAPHVFRGAYELPIGMASAALLVLVTLRRDPSSVFYRARWRPSWLLLVALTMALIFQMSNRARHVAAGTRVMVRNFYGVLRVIDLPRTRLVGPRRILVNGTIWHGEQFLDPDRRHQPTSYYAPRSGVGLALHECEERSGLRIGVIGLGAGTIATYGKPGDHFTFYEINPLVVRLAETEFTFLRDAEAKVDIVLGDARLSLEREPLQGFDLIALDAFSGDAIPVHLLTREAFGLYFRHLKRTGVLAVNISSKFFNLQPVLQRAAESMGKRAIVIDTPENYESQADSSTWVLISDRREFFEQIDIKSVATPLQENPKVRLWTDDYSNLIRVLAW